MSSSTNRNEILNKVHEALKSCAVAENPEQARNILNELFVFNNVEDLEMIRYLMIELCVSIFHGVNLHLPSASSPTLSPELEEQQRLTSQHGRQSKLGTVNFPPLSSVTDPKNPGDPYEYDEYSDDSNADNDNYSSYSKDENNSQKNQSTEEQWAQALSQDIQQHSYSPDQVTCEDLFHALAANLSSVVLPKVPLIPTSHSSSSSTPSVVSTSPSVPSFIPYSTNSYNSPSHSINSSTRSSPTDDYHHVSHEESDFNNNQQEYPLKSLSKNEDENEKEQEQDQDDLSSVDTIDAIHDESHRSRRVQNEQNVPPSTPPSASIRPTRYHQHHQGQTKAKSSRKIIHIRGPTRLRNIIENAVKGVIQECEFETSSTPQKHNVSSKINPEGTQPPSLRLTNPILKRITRSVSIELSLELSANAFVTTSDHQLHSTQLERPQQSSPAARDLSNLLWPAISGFVGTEATPEMIGVFVDLIEADVIDKKIFPDLYVNQIEEFSDQQYGTTLFVDDDQETRIRDTQEGIISQYVHEIDMSRHQEDNYESKTTSHPTNLKNEGKRTKQSVSRQILDLDGEFDEETSEFYQRSKDLQQKNNSKNNSNNNNKNKSSPPSNREIPAWKMPISPMDQVFRQTVGALGSNKKLPYIPVEDMNDSSTNVSENTPRSQKLELNEHDFEQELYRGIQDSDYDSPYEHIHEDTEFVDSYRQAEEEILGFQSQTHSEDSVSDVPDSSLQPQVDTEQSEDDDDDDDGNDNDDNDNDNDKEDNDEDYISISDLPPDFGPHPTENLSHDLVGVYHSEPPLSEEDLESLEKQMDQLNNSQSSRLFSQPSIAEIIVGEADNLIVLPRGESPVSSPDARLLGHSIVPKKEEKLEADNLKYINHFPRTSSDSEPSEINEVENDSLENMSTPRPTSTNNDDNIQIETLLSEDPDEVITNRQNWMYSGSNPHIPPSPFIDDGFKNQIPFPKAMNGLSPTASIDFQAISASKKSNLLGGEDHESGDEEEDEYEENEVEIDQEDKESGRRRGKSRGNESDNDGGGDGDGNEDDYDYKSIEHDEEIEPRQIDQSFLIPSPQRHRYYQPTNIYEEKTDNVIKSTTTLMKSSSSSSEDNTNHDDPPQSETILNTSRYVMNSDDEREEDRRLFDSIMSDKPKKSSSKQHDDIIPNALNDFPPPTDEEMQEYFAEMRRTSHLPYNNYIFDGNQRHYNQFTTDDESETTLQVISAHAIENMDKRFHDLFEKHLPNSSMRSSMNPSNVEDRLNEMETKVNEYQTKKKGLKKGKKKHRDVVPIDDLDTQEVLAPDVYLSVSSSTPEYRKRINEILHSSGGRGRGSGNNTSRHPLPVTGNEELNKMFTQSFQDTLSLYQTNPSEATTNQETHSHHSHHQKIPIQSTKKDRTPVHLPTPENSVNKNEIKTHGRVKQQDQKRYLEPELDLGEGDGRGYSYGVGEGRGEGDAKEIPLRPTNEKLQIKIKKEKILKGERSSSPHGRKESNKGRSPGVQGYRHEEITPSSDYSRHLHGNIPSTGRVVYGIHNDNFNISQEWNTTNNRPGRRQSGLQSPSSAPSSPTGKRSTKSTLQSRSPDITKKKKSLRLNSSSVGAGGNGGGSGGFAVESDHIISKRTSSARQIRKSSNTNLTSFQHLTAPTFSSVIRSLNIAGIDYNEVQAIAQASKDANNYLTSQHADLSHPSYVDSYYTTGIDVISALANNNNNNMKRKKKQK